MFKHRKKNTRQRAATTHGWGSMKKHRGAGHRGGRGNAGSGKRGDAKKPSYWKDLKRYGKHGFTSHAPEKGAAVNVGHLSSAAERMVLDCLAVKKGDVFVMDLGKLGIERLLGAGKVAVKLEISVESASARAVEKAENAGGKVTVTAKAAPAPEPAPAEA
ncbi:50S ribosomal protein L15 [Candidatus Woesearchaeota archaeon]|nr:50S ribosomal protein L15 [Candidatus Woesearchaeota archaeon]